MSEFESLRESELAVTHRISWCRTLALTHPTILQT